MGQFSKWLMGDDQKELFEIVVASALNILFLALIALLLWPLHKTSLAFRMAKGYAVLWIVTFITAMLVNRIQEFFRVNLYDHPNAYLISNLAASCLLQLGWSAFAALTVYSFVIGASTWVMVTLYLVGGLSCLVAYFVVSSLYQGHVYKLISLPLALVGFILFSVGYLVYTR